MATRGLPCAPAIAQVQFWVLPRLRGGPGSPGFKDLQPNVSTHIWILDPRRAGDLSPLAPPLGAGTPRLGSLDSTGLSCCRRGALVWACTWDTAAAGSSPPLEGLRPITAP